MFRINRVLLPVKAHYTCFYGGLAGIIPFLMILLMQLGISLSTIGLLYGILPFLKMVSKPLFGSIADKFRLHKAMFVFFKVVMTSSLLAIYFIPLPTEIMVTFKNEEEVSFIGCQHLNEQYFRLCPYSNTSTNNEYLPICNISCVSGTSCISDTFCDHLLNASTIKSASNYYDSKSSILNNNFSNCSNYFTVPLEQFNFSITVPSCYSDGKYGLPCASACNTSLSQNGIGSSYFEMGNEFTLISLCMVIAWTSMAVAENTGDVIALEFVKEQNSGFGNERVWGSISWGLLAIVAGQLIDLASEGKKFLDFSPGYVIVLIVGVIDVIVSLRIKVTFAVNSKNMAKKVGSVFRKLESIVFTIEVFVVGVMTGVLWTFLNVYVVTLGASQLLVGLTMASQCFLGEIPFFFIADWFLKKIGHAHAMTLTMGIFAIRFVLYYLLVNPWWVLVIEIAQGINFGVFFTSLATYSSRMALPGTEATVQGIEQAVFEGFGVGVGSLAAGVLFEKYGGRYMFLFFGILCAVSCVFCVFAQIWLPDKKLKKPISIEIPDIRNDDQQADTNTKMLQA